MNVDEELGLVEPLITEKGYTFPVLPAYTFIHNMLDSVGVPQNWILDRQGRWQWQMLGFNSMEVDWEARRLPSSSLCRRECEDHFLRERRGNRAEINASCG